ncbi:MAG: SPFH domain-containing protein [Phycisphaerae bacterium]
MRKTILYALAGILLVVMTCLLCTYIRRPYEEVVVDRFGSLVEAPTALAYNWHVCLPTDRLVRIDTRMQLAETALEPVNAGGEPLNIQAFALWQVDNAKLYYQRLQANDGTAQRRITEKVAALTKSMIQQYRMDDLFNADAAKIKLGVLEQQIATAADRDLKDLGLRVRKVGIPRISFPPTAAESVYKRMSSERNIQAQTFQSQGESISKTIRSEADREARARLSAAQAEAQQIRANGDAKALQLLAEVQQTREAREFYRFFKSLEVLRAGLTKNSYLVLDVDHPLLAPLLNSPATQPAGGK